LKEVSGVEGRLRRGRGKAAGDALRDERHEDIGDEAVPALLRLLNRHDHPAARSRTGGMKDLPLRNGTELAIHRDHDRLVLLLGAARKEVSDTVFHENSPRMWGRLTHQARFFGRIG